MNRFIATLIFVIAIFCGVVAPALAGTTIPLDLVIVLDPEGYIQPTCSKCEDIVLETQSSGSQAALTMIYRDEQQRDFVGTVAVTVVLDDGTKDTFLIEDEWLTDGDEAGWVLDAPGTWSWGNVQKAELRFLGD